MALQPPMSELGWYHAELVLYPDVSEVREVRVEGLEELDLVVEAVGVSELDLVAAEE